MSYDLPTLEQQISTAIGQQETAGGTTGVGASLYNPGGLKYAGWESTYGATQGAGGFAKFPSLTQGWAALKDRVNQLIMQGRTLQELVNVWAPASDGNTNNPQRISQIASITKLDPTIPIVSQYSGSLIPPDVAAQANPDQKFLDTPEGQAMNQDMTQKLFGTTWGRVAAFLVGLLFLIAGLMLLKQTQIVIEQSKRAAGRIGATAAAFA